MRRRIRKPTKVRNIIPDSQPKPQVTGLWHYVTISREANQEQTEKAIKECHDTFVRKYKREPATVFIYKREGIVVGGPLHEGENIR